MPGLSGLSGLGGASSTFGSGYGPLQSVTLQPAGAGIDSYIQDDTPNANYDGLQTLNVGDSNGGGNRIQRPVIKFDLTGTGIAATAKIVSATLSLYDQQSFTAGGPASWTVNVHRLLQNWVEAQVTWNNYSVGNPWTTAGGDFVATVSAALVLDGVTDNAFENFSDEQLRLDIASFICGDYDNYGWLLDAPGLVGLGVNRATNRFSSSDHPTGAQRPKLTITYREKT